MLAFEDAAAFEALDLSPVVPLGAARALGGTSPANVIATVRGVEIAGDPTTALALEAARRRRGSRDGVVRLCAVSRVVRMQPVPPPLLPHFKLFGALTAGTKADVIPSLREHLALQLEVVSRLRGDGLRIAGCVAELSDPACVAALLARAGLSADEVRRRVRAHQFTGSEDFLRERGLVLPRGALGDLDLGGLPPRLRARLAQLASEILDPLVTRFPFATLRVDLSRLEGLGYYAGPTLRVSIQSASGAWFPIADGGVLDWTARLLGDGAERLVTSGMGVDLVCSSQFA